MYSETAINRLKLAKSSGLVKIEKTDNGHVIVKVPLSFAWDDPDRVSRELIDEGVTILKRKNGSSYIVLTTNLEYKSEDFE